MLSNFSEERPKLPDDGGSWAADALSEDTLSSGASRGTITKDRTVPLAVIGLSLKFPQEATSPDAFWQMLIEGRSARTEFPRDRFGNNGSYHPASRRQGQSTYPTTGHFLKEGLAVFDAPFFSLTPEAAEMDPQQRGLLETAYRALENAGIPIASIAGSKTSVHVGSLCQDWRAQMTRDPIMNVDARPTSSLTSFLANRLSWFYDLKGPSISLDTACSSGMMALHLACESLRNQETDMALVGGVNVILDPQVSNSMADSDMLSPDGKCYTFDHRANGYSRGEGFGILIVKRLADALRDGDTIRSIIRATGTNQDGKTPSVSQPSQDAQEKLIRDTYNSAGLDLKLTRYFEAHGTGTKVGDPIEVRAIASTFKCQRPRNEPLYIGALKTNIGHLEGASGVASVIKAIMVLEKGIIPPNLWFEKANPEIFEDEWNLKFPLKKTPWPTKGLRRASVNSFGFGGSNVHVVLEDVYHYLNLRGLNGNHCTTSLAASAQDVSKVAVASVDEPPRARTDAPSQHPMLLVWSAADKDGVKRLASVFSVHLSTVLKTLKNHEVYFKNLAYTLTCKRSLLRWRSFALASCTEELKNTLEQRSLTAVRSKNVPEIAFVFTGQGAQWHGMGKELLRYHVFRNSLSETQKSLSALGCEWSLLEILSKDDSVTDIHDPAYSQPICTSLQIALVDLLLTWGLYPSAVLGHSSGEIAAAYCAGALSRDSALRIAYYRGYLTSQLISSNRTQGAMMSVNLSESEVQPYLTVMPVETSERQVAVACINSPRNITLSGSEKEINELATKFNRASVVHRKLKVGVAYHSIAMAEIACEYCTMIRDLTGGEYMSRRPLMISSVTGTAISIHDAMKSQYWVDNLISQVRFSDAFLELCLKQGISIPTNRQSNKKRIAVTDILELGPHSSLKGPINDVLKLTVHDRSITYTAMLNRNVSAVTSSLAAMGHMYCQGYPLRLDAINDTVAGSSRCQVLADLPAYPFDHSKSYWSESRLNKNYRLNIHRPHELLGVPACDWDPMDARWRQRLRVSETHWLADHKINGIILFPAAGLISMAVEAARQTSHKTYPITGYKLVDIHFSKALMSFSDAEDFEIQLQLQPLWSDNERSPWRKFRISSHEKGKWSENCQGTIAVQHEEADGEVDDGRESKEEMQNIQETYHSSVMDCGDAIKPDLLYEKLRHIGINYGPAFQVLEQIYHNQGRSTAKVRLSEWAADLTEKEYKKYVLHPTVLDGVLQVAFPVILRKAIDQIPTMIPERIQSLWISSQRPVPPATNFIKAHATCRDKGLRKSECAVFALDDISNQPQVVVEGLEFTAVESLHGEKPSDSTEYKRLCYGFEWRPDIDLLNQEDFLAYCKEVAPDNLPSSKLIEDVEFICFATISNVLKDLVRLNVQPVKPHLQRYIDWMKRESKRYAQGEIIHWLPEWPERSLDKVYINEVLHRIEKFDAAGRLYVETSRQLLSILEEKFDPLDLLFNSELAAAHYAHISRQIQGPMRSYLDVVVHKNPGVKVLEIGAGTGGTTSFILETLMRQSEAEFSTTRCQKYVYTDISRGFFEKAKERFEAHADRIIYSTLDIEKDPLNQGFQEEEFDIIIAANVLHATPDLQATLRNTRKLLKVGGKFILYEHHNDAVVRAGFTFGLLPGWWLSTEDNRQWGPLLPPDSWHELLVANGFSGTDLVFHDFPDPRNRLSNVMTSTAVAKQSSDDFVIIPDVSILVSRSSDLQLAIAHEVETHLKALGSQTTNIVKVEHLSAKVPNQRFCISLVEVENSLLHKIGANEFEMLKYTLTSAAGLLWVTQRGVRGLESPPSGMIVGLFRTILSETQRARLITLELDNLIDFSRVARHITKVVANTLGQSSEQYETEYEERNNRLCVNRITEAAYLNRRLCRGLTGKPNYQKFGHDDRALALHIGTPGLLDALEFIDDPQFGKPLAQDQVEIKVKAVGVNFKDILTALGHLPEADLGLECSGLVTRAWPGLKVVPGDRVCVIATGTYRTYVRTQAENVYKIRDEMSFSEAAAFPVVYCTAYQAVYERARLVPGESILIHSGAGGTGQAAIQLSKLCNAEIFATVGTQEKKKLLMDLYAIPENHIFDSRGMSFKMGVKRMTKGRGVDVILNSLSGESLQGSWGCLAPFGRFVEIGKNDILKGNSLPMLPFDQDRTFTAVNLVHMFSERPSAIKKMMQSILSLAQCGHISPPKPLHVYNISQVEDAFRYLQGGRNTGKSILKIDEEDVVPVVPSCSPSCIFSSNKTYVVSGGLGGLGRMTARWMIDQGAKYLVLISRSGATTTEAKTFVEEIQASGVTVATPKCDISNESSVKSTLLQLAESMPPIRGCIQASMVLQNSFFEKMTLDNFFAAIKPKVHGSWNLHTLLPRDLDFFILLSSMTGIIGATGHANYAAGNTFQDSLARYRVLHGEKAASIDLGAVLSTGYVAEHTEAREVVERSGLPPNSEAELLSLLEVLCDPSLEILSPMKSHVILGLPTPATLRAQGIEEPPWIGRPQFKALHLVDSRSTGAATIVGETVTTSVLLSDADSISQAADIISSALRRKLSRILSLPPEDIDMTISMHALGVDSLIALEIRNWFYKEVNAEVTLFEVLGNDSGSDFCLKVAKAGRHGQAVKIEKI